MSGRLKFWRRSRDSNKGVGTRRLKFIRIARGFALRRSWRLRRQISFTLHLPILVGVTRDAISDKITDLAYATTRNKWDSVICVTLSFVQTDTKLLDVTCFVRLHTLLHVVGSCWAKFETGQNFEPTTPNIAFVPWSLAQQCQELLRPFTFSFITITFGTIMIRSSVTWSVCWTTINGNKLRLNIQCIR